METDLNLARAVANADVLRRSAGVGQILCQSAGSCFRCNPELAIPPFRAENAAVGRVIESEQFYYSGGKRTVEVESEARVEERAVALDRTEIRCEPDIALWPILGEFVIGTADAERHVHDGSAHHRKGENCEVDAAGAGECEARGQGEDRQRKEVDGVALGGESGGD